MNWRRTWAIARKEFMHVRRDRQSLAGAIALPVLLLIVFGWGLSLDVHSISLAVWDQSGTPRSRDLVQRFEASGFFEVRSHADSYREIERAIDRREVLMAIVIPADLAEAGAGRTTRVQLICDGSDANTAMIALGYAENIVSQFSESVALQALRRSGAVIAREPVDFRPRVWFNPDLESRNFLVPGLIAIIMMTIGALLTSLTIAREWERGTMEQLIATPVTGPELIVGKLGPYFAIGFFDMVLAVLMGRFLFDVPLRGSPALLFVVASVFLVVALSLGMLVSVTTKSQLVANQQAIIFTFLPALVLSGFIFAIGNMPVAVQAITYLVPARFFVTSLNGIFLKGVGLEALALEVALLVLFAATFLWLASARFRKSIE